MSEELYMYIDHAGLIISPKPFSTRTRKRLKQTLTIIMYQLLTDIPVFCLLVVPKDYPELFPGYFLIPESDWGNVELKQPAITFMNNSFIEGCTKKSSAELQLSDLHTIFDIITDPEKLQAFGNEHGLIVGGTECRD